MIGRLWARLTPDRHLQQLTEAERELLSAREFLQEVDAREPLVNELMRRLDADRRRNHYGPTIAAALFGKE